MGSHRKTETKDSNSKEGNTEKYYMDLCGGAELKAPTSEPQESPKKVLMTQLTGHEERESMSSSPLLSYL